MSNTKSLAMAAILSTGAMALQAAPAQDQHFYLGVSFGKSDLDVSESEITAVLNDGSLSGANFDNEDSSLKLYGGYAINKNVAIEFGYIDLGEFDYSATSDGSGSLWSSGPLTIDTETTGLLFNVKGSLPVSDIFGLTAKLGLLAWDIEADASNGGLSGSADDDGNDLFFGVGASARLAQHVGIDLEFERYDIDGDDLDVFSLGISYHFPQ